MNDDRTPSPDPIGHEPERIGPYRILERLGEGGMGVVYRAEQEHPVRRQVALKRIKLGMDTEQVIRRFEDERQALARMEHPNVARVYDAGATEDGRPYFVMELVDGQPITGYCDAHDLDMRDRLRLFAEVCDAVQHAHRKGIIHRDLKPSNVLVAEQDGRPQAKIIDFGIAKSTERERAGREAFTQFGQLIGTPEYMSPEQADSGAVDIDTRSDVYSLGVVLYELLTGRLPFDAAALRRAGLEEIQRIIRQVEPPRPSTRFSDLGHDSREIARRRRTDVGTLSRQLRNDLDWVVMKALEKDREHRYGSASDLARDVRRFLADEPVEAGPPGRGYRVHKFVRRHRGAVAAAVALAAVILIGAAGTTWQGLRAVRAGNEAQRQAEVARAVNDFLNRDLLASVAPENRGRDVTVREVLDTAAGQIDERLAETPLVRAAVRSTLGSTYRSLGEFDEAESQLRLSLEILEARPGPPDRGTLATTFELGLVLLDRGRFDESELLLTRALDGRLELLGDEHPETLTSMTGLGLLHFERGRFDDAERWLVQALEAQRRVLGERHPDTLATKSDLSRLRVRQGDNEAALRLRLDVLEIRRDEFGPRHPDTLRAVGHLAQQYRKQGAYAEAEPLYLEYYEGRREVLGDDHPGTLTAMTGLGLLYKQQGRYPEAEALYLRGLETRRRVLGPEHPQTLSSMLNVGSLYRSQGRYAEAAELLQRVYEERAALLGRVHPSTLNAMNALASTLQSLGRRDEAGALYREALDNARRELGDDSPTTVDCVLNLALWYWKQGEYELALPLSLENVERTARLRGVGHPDTLTAQHNLALLYLSLDRIDDAEPLLTEVVHERRRSLGDDHPDTLTSVNALSEAYYSQQRFDESWRLAAEALASRERTLGPDHPSTLTSRHNLASLHGKQERLEEARGLYEETLVARRRVLGPDHPHTLVTTYNLAGILDRLGRTSEAEQLAAMCVDHARNGFPVGHWQTGVFLVRRGMLLVKLDRNEPAEVALLEAHAVLEAARGARDERTREAAQALVGLYETWGRGDDAAIWRSRL